MDQSDTDSSLTEKAGNTENKRRLVNDAESCASPEVFKKARYSWQIKGKSDSHKNHQKQGHEKFLENHEQEPSSSEKILTEKESRQKHENDQESMEPFCEKKIPEKQSSQTCILSSDCESEGALMPVKDAQIDKKSRASSTETQTKFEMLREIGNEYTERIEEFLKSQAKEFVDTCESSESSDSDIEEIKEDVLSEYENVLTEYARENHSSNPNQSGSPVPQNPAGIRSHGRLSFDSPQLNHHLFNISGWLWQKQEIGCAIVDNVFNRTLEEMGLSPDPEANLQATTRLRVEHQSIEAAISNQGLALQDNMDDDTNDYMSSAEESEESTDKTNFETIAERHAKNSTIVPSNFDQSSFVNNKTDKSNKTKDAIEISSVNDINSNSAVSSCDREIKIMNQENIEYLREKKNDDKSSLSLPKASAQLPVMCSKSEKGDQDTCTPSVMGISKVFSLQTPGQNTGTDVQDTHEIDIDNAMEAAFVEKRAKVEFGEFDGSNAPGLPDNILDIAVSTAIKSKGLL